MKRFRRHSGRRRERGKGWACGSPTPRHSGPSAELLDWLGTCGAELTVENGPDRKPPARTTPPLPRWHQGLKGFRPHPQRRSRQRPPDSSALEEDRSRRPRVARDTRNGTGRSCSSSQKRRPEGPDLVCLAERPGSGARQAAGAGRNLTRITGLRPNTLWQPHKDRWSSFDRDRQRRPDREGSRHG